MVATLAILFTTSMHATEILWVQSNSSDGQSVLVGPSLRFSLVLMATEGFIWQVVWE